MRTFFRNFRTEVKISFALIFAGWMGALAVHIAGAPHGATIILANFLIGAAIYLPIHDLCADKPYDRTLTEVKVAAILGILGWVGIFFHGVGAGVLVAGNLSLVAGIYLLIHAHYPEWSKPGL